MDMSMSGTPWLDQPVMLHGSREVPPCTLTPEQCAYKMSHWRFWYRADLVYALNTVYFALAMIAVFAAAHLVATIVPKRWRQSPAYQKLLSVSRFLSYRSFHVKALGWYTAPAGILLLTAVGVTFFFAMTLGPKPYYWPKLEGDKSYGDSPPIATRAGWMAIALLPFVIALPTKMNFITGVTGIPHEKLQHFHRWSAYAMFILALIHTFPFIIRNISVGEMVMSWQTSVFYWTGVVALLAQGWLTLFSFEAIRNRFYELFKATHLLAAVVFAVFLFLHCDYTLTSWDYFIAAGVLYTSAYLLAVLRTFMEHGLRKATITLMPHDTVRIAIPSHSEWNPGQHIFVRFPTLGIHHAISSHPFTICSLDASSEIVLYVKPRAGLTRRLANACLSRESFNPYVLVDGPYGGLSQHTLTGFDKNIVIAGGSGTSFALPLIEDVLRRRCVDDKVNTGLQVIVSTRNAEAAIWFKAEVTALFQKYQAFDADADELPSVAIHLTGEVSDESILFNQFDRKDADKPSFQAKQEVSLESAIEMHRGRPTLPELIQQAAKQRSGSLAVAVCGPASMLFDVRRASAEVQTDILKKRTRLTELYLHTEHFGL